MSPLYSALKSGSPQGAPESMSLAPAGPPVATPSQAGGLSLFDAMRMHDQPKPMGVVADQYGYPDPTPGPNPTPAPGSPAIDPRKVGGDVEGANPDDPVAKWLINRAKGS